MGSESDPTRYRFEHKKNMEGGKTTTYERYGIDGGVIVNVVVMKYGNDGDAFHEQLHGYLKGQEFMGNPTKMLGAEEEAAAKRREFSAISTNERKDQPLMRNGYFGITTDKWVESVIRAHNEYKIDNHKPKVPPEYKYDVNEWERANDQPETKF